jgi:hypothetical protein
MKERQGCLTAILSLFGIHLAGPASDSQLPYRQRDDFLSAAELSFYRVLRQSIGDQAVVFCKVNLADIFFVALPNENQSYRNKIDRKHVDFLVCDPTTLRPRLGIELDDASHGRRDRQQRDEFVDAVFSVAGLPLLRIPAKTGYNPTELLSRVLPHLETVVQNVVAAQVVGNDPPICPKCRVPMVLRTASKGKHTGNQFYGCPNYPRCKEIVGG